MLSPSPVAVPVVLFALAGLQAFALVRSRDLARALEKALGG